MKNMILKTITLIAIYTMAMSALAVDSSSWVPTILFSASLCWVAMFFTVNYKYYQKRGLLN